MSKHKVQTTFMNIGASSLLVIFIVLCIAIFATLSLSSAKSDYSFSENMAQHKADYYAACNEAEHLLDRADAILAETAAVSSDAQNYYEIAEAMMEAKMAGVTNNDQGIPTVSWKIPIDNSQVLDVQLLLIWPSDGGETGYYKIIKWQTAGR